MLYRDKTNVIKYNVEDPSKNSKIKTSNKKTCPIGANASSCSVEGCWRNFQGCPWKINNPDSFLAAISTYSLFLLCINLSTVNRFSDSIFLIKSFFNFYFSIHPKDWSGELFSTLNLHSFLSWNFRWKWVLYFGNKSNSVRNSFQNLGSFVQYLQSWKL